MKLWYEKPADEWKTQALPIGNGNLGGMIFGGTDRERIQLNEITLWAGGPKSSPEYNGGNAEGAFQHIEKVREALFAGDYEKATEISKKLLGNQIGYNGYQDLGSLYIDFAGDAKTSSPMDYRRELDLSDGVQRVFYTNNGVKFQREYFCSSPDKLMAIHLTAEQKDKLEFRLSLELNTSDAGNTPGNYPVPSKNFDIWVENDTIFCQGKESSSQMAFAVQMKVIAPEAVVIAEDRSLHIKKAKEATILVAAKTNYDLREATNINGVEDFRTECGDYLANDDPNGEGAMRQVTTWIESGTMSGYAELRKRHQEDYKKLFDRVKIVLGSDDSKYTGIPTDKLLEKYKSGNINRYLETLLFQYGRYLLISSSRDAQLPANLQGLWNDSNQPAWMGDYHFDVNLEMNYWPAFVTNLAETAEPLVTYVDSLRKPGNVTAREVFGVQEGWLVNAQTNIFGLTGTNAAKLAWGFQPGCAAWICNNLWDYYLFTQDIQVLQRIYPIIKEAALFWKGWLVEDPRTQQRDEMGNLVSGTGELVAAPSLSPEQTEVTVSIGASYDMMLSYMLFENVMEAAKILDTDAGLCAELSDMMTRMQPIQIGESGQIKEFREETTVESMPGAEKGHRHMSQMMALHPGNMITQETSEWMKAAIVSLNARGEGNGNGTGGWSMAQKGNLWARTGNGERALHFLQKLIIGGGIYSNLFDQVSGYFQIDGNLGYTAGVAEMLLQSHAGYIEPLAALPPEWKDGSYQGLVARGNFETDAVWTEGKLERFTIRSGSGKECVVRYPGISNAVMTMQGKNISYEIMDDNTISFATEKGFEYVIICGFNKNFE